MRRWAVVLILIGLVPLLGAQTRSDYVEAELERLVSQSPKMHYHKLLEFHEKKLERIYQARIKGADAELKDALQKAQKEWIDFYKAERVVGAIEHAEGSGSYMHTMGRRLHILKARTHQLATPYLQGWPEVPRVPDVGAFAEPGPKVHTVRKGETLSGIARQYDVSVKELIRLNGLADPDRIRVGQRLRIPD